MLKKMYSFILLLFVLFTFTACGGGSSDTPASSSADSKYSLEYKGLVFYTQAMSSSNYTLKPLSDSEFNTLNENQKLVVADKLLATLFYGYNLKKLEEKVNSGSFISSISKDLQSELNDKGTLESYIIDANFFYQNDSTEQEAIDILTRFYAAEHLDKYFFNNWVAYMLTQTIMFSPSYELDSSHNPNVASVYNRLVSLLEEEAGMRYITYVHMMSEDNWRRFRSPEDNGREMLEIYTYDMDDAHVPLAGKALQNWKLDRDYDTLVVGLNENTQAINLFNTTIYNGDDFYRELVKSSSFTHGVVKRLVSFFFTEYTTEKIDTITANIVASRPESWQDILKQIVFSKEYLLNNSRAKSAEELFFSLARKMDFKHRSSTFYYFKNDLDTMHQASMKYKLGKLTRVPLDTLSFATYSKSIRDNILLRRSNPAYIDDYTRWDRQGWSDSFLDNENFEYDYLNEEKSLESFINYLFKSLIAREATTTELNMFKTLMLEEKDGVKILVGQFDMFSSRDSRDSYKRNIAVTVLDYLSRVDRLYAYSEVK